MSTPTILDARNAVTLLRLGVGMEQIPLREGATLADVLREAGVDPSGQEVLVDGRRIEEALTLQPGTIVSVGARATNGQPEQPAWMKTIGMFKDDPIFEEMMNDVNAQREAEKNSSPGSALDPRR